MEGSKRGHEAGMRLTSPILNRTLNPVLNPILNPFLNPIFNRSKPTALSFGICMSLGEGRASAHVLTPDGETVRFLVLATPPLVSTIYTGDSMSEMEIS